VINIFSYEIDVLLRSCNYNIDSKTYVQITTTSSQINHIKYDPYSNLFHMWSNDGWYWEFSVYPN
jgi:hypothetical protein